MSASGSLVREQSAGHRRRADAPCARGQLVTDPTYGTAIVEHVRLMPVMWPPGYVGRQIGSDIEVLDTSGQVVARTGNLVQLPVGYSGSDPRVFLTCGYVR